MKITKEQLKKLIIETIDEMRIDTVSGYTGNQGGSTSAENEMPQDLKDILGSKFAHLETEYDEELGSWIVYFETGDNTYWSLRPPPGWKVKQTDIGAYDGDEQYIMHRANDGSQYNENN